MKIAFVYITDERGFQLASCSAMSVVLSQPLPCDVHIFCHRFRPEHASTLRSAIADIGANLTFHSVSDLSLEHHRTHGHVTTATLLKLTAIKTLTGCYDRLVYLDNDVLVFNTLNIQSIDFGNMPIAAVHDMDLSQTGSLRNSTWVSGQTGVQTMGRYFNAGVMIFHSLNLECKDYLLAYADALNNHEQHCEFKINCTSGDQCGLNKAFEENWIELRPEFNLQAGAKFTEQWSTASVRHYCGPRKFLPLSLFRNDSRDVKYLNIILGKLKLPNGSFPLLYEVFFKLNVIRNYRRAFPMRQYLGSLNSFGSCRLLSKGVTKRGLV